MNKKLLDLLDNYIETGKVDNVLLAEFDMSSQELQALLSLMDDFMETMNIWGRAELKKEMALWDEELDAKENASFAPKDSKDIPQATLEVYFASNPMYAHLLKGAVRNTMLIVETPSSGFEWTQTKYLFQCAPFSYETISYIIENNRREIIKEDSTPINNYSFFVELEYQDLLPGRYYLKLLFNNSFTLYEFFINKSLMPE